MLKLKKIAVTGSLGSGKTVVCDILKSLGGYIVDTDEIAHELLLHNKDCIQKVVDLLGQDVKVDDHIDRKKVADLVFSNKDNLLSLERIVHPLVFKKMDLLYKEVCNKKNVTFFVAEVPLLYEAGWEFFFDTVILVTCQEAVASQRSLAKGISRLQYNQRIARLFSLEEKKRKADFILVNEGPVETLKEKVKSIVEEIL